MGMPTYYRLTESGIGDLRLEGKALLATLGEDDEYTLGLSAGLTLPTGKSGGRAYLGDKMVTGRIKALAAAELGPGARSGRTWACCCARRRTASRPSSARSCSTARPRTTRSTTASTCSWSCSGAAASTSSRSSTPT